MEKVLGTLDRVRVREFWKNEQHEFTPWLAREENIAKLSEVLGLELEVENIEVAVGPYSADILAKDTSTDRYVVIENQFGKTNHDHLGKLITYGSVLDAGTIIWIAEHFSEEHRKALDWLNDHTDEDLAFYGVHLELWQIDHSRPAVRFNVVSEPPSVRRKVAKGGNGGEGLSEARKLQLGFWTEFAQILQDKKIVARGESPRPKYWYNVSIGRSGIHLSNFLNTTHHRMGIRVIVRSRNSEEAFAQLRKQQDAIEKEIGATLVWEPRPGKVGSIIRLVHNDVDLTKKEAWPSYLAWMVEMTARFKKAFGPRVKELDLRARKPEPDEEVVE